MTDVFCCCSEIMASVEGDSQPAVSSSGPDVHPDAPLSAVTENAVHITDAEARCVLVNCILS